MIILKRNLSTIKTIINQSKKWWLGEYSSPPYPHIVQLGDPILRQPASLVPSTYFNSDELKSLVAWMKRVKDGYNCIGISAPQIGIPLRVIILEFRDDHLAKYGREIREMRAMEMLPLTVLVNPTMKVFDYKHTANFPEACESVKGYTANVKRYLKAECQAFDVTGAPVKIQLNGWNARIFQHEMDHLNGVVYTDIMDVKSFTCNCWEAVNFYQGRIQLPFSPTFNKEGIWKRLGGVFNREKR